MAFAGVNARPLLGQATLTFRDDSNAVLQGPFPLSDGYIQPFQLAPWNAPVLPSPTSDEQTNPDNLRLRGRYIRIQTSPGALLGMKEVFVFDSTYTNVSRDGTVGDNLVVV